MLLNRRSQNGIVHGIVPKNRHFKVVRHMGTQKLVFMTASDINRAVLFYGAN